MTKIKYCECKNKNVKCISILYAYCLKHAYCKNSMSSTVFYFEHSCRRICGHNPLKWNFADLSWTTIKGEQTTNEAASDERGRSSAQPKIKHIY